MSDCTSIKQSIYSTDAATFRFAIESLPKRRRHLKAIPSRSVKRFEMVKRKQREKRSAIIAERRLRADDLEHPESIEDFRVEEAPSSSSSSSSSSSPSSSPSYLSQAPPSPEFQQLPTLTRVQAPPTEETPAASGQLQVQSPNAEFEYDNDYYNTLMASKDDKVLISNRSAIVTGKDIKRLKQHREGGDPHEFFLNDELINAYLGLLSRDAPADKVLIVNTHFFPKLQEHYANVKGWYKRVNKAEVAKILVPINRNSHWTLAVINNKQKKIEYYDSLMKLDGDKHMKVLLDYLKKDNVNTEFDFDDYKLVHVIDIPVQKNGYDCGVFIATYAHHIVKNSGSQMNFSQSDMSALRQKFALSIAWEEPLLG